MRLVLDQGVPRDAASLLRDLGMNVRTPAKPECRRPRMLKSWHLHLERNPQ
jgi:hypothetical protein